MYSDGMNVDRIVSGAAPGCGLDERSLYAVSCCLGAAGRSPMPTVLIATAATLGVTGGKIGVAP